MHQNIFFFSVLKLVLWNFLGVQKNDILFKFYWNKKFDFGLSLWLTGPLGLRHILIVILEILAL